MKRIFFLAIIISFFSCSQSRQKVISGLEGKPLPSFTMLLTDSVTLLDSKNIHFGQPIVFFYFNPSCPYCRAQTEDIKTNISSLKNIQLYFLSSHPLSQIKKFDAHYKLSNHENITLAQIRDTSFRKYYNIPGVPYFAIYDKQRILKEVMLGKSDLGDIKNIAFDNN